MRLDFTPNYIAIFLRTSEGVAAADEIDIEYAGDPFATGFNAAYLAEILNQAGGDTVRIKFGAEASAPTVIADRSGTGLYVLMPMRI